jgi:hypothetical protein
MRSFPINRAGIVYFPKTLCHAAKLHFLQRGLCFPAENLTAVSPVGRISLMLASNRAAVSPSPDFWCLISSLADRLFLTTGAQLGATASLRCFQVDDSLAIAWLFDIEDASVKRIQNAFLCDYSPFLSRSCCTLIKTFIVCSSSMACAVTICCGGQLRVSRTNVKVKIEKGRLVVGRCLLTGTL